jgi:hypothetical protein
MAENTHKLTMDKAGLRSFVDNQIVPFGNTLDKIAHVDTDEGVTVGTLVGKGKVTGSDHEIFKTQRPLTIGQLANEESRTNGKGVVGQINKVADSISTIFVAQIKLFGDLHRNLDSTITKLLDGQHENLVKIDGKSFMDGLGTVPGDFQGTGSQPS